VLAFYNAAQFAQRAMSAGCGNGGCVGDGGQTVGPSGNSGQTASPGGPQDPLGPFKNEAESYQFRTSGTRFGKEPTLQVNIDGKSETIRPDNIVNGYLRDSKYLDPASGFYSKQIGKVGTGLDLHIKTWGDMVEKYSLAAQQNGYVGVQVLVNNQEAVKLASEMYAAFKNVQFIYAP
jgi:hypothetical protein